MRGGGGIFTGGFLVDVFTEGIIVIAVLEGLIYLCFVFISLFIFVINWVLFSIS